MPALTSDPVRHLRIWTSPKTVAAVVLVLHGGRAESAQPTRPWQSAVLRMVPFVRAIRRSADDVAVALARYRVRGWNGAEASPVADTRHALATLRRTFPNRPVGVIGHSLGGRTALRIADDSAVRSVAALAPWLPAGEPIPDLRGRVVLLAHGDRDRTTDPADSADYAVRVRNSGAQASYVTLTGDGHAMLRRSAVWHQLAATFVLGGLHESVDLSGVVGEVVKRALAGEPELTI